jgi:hypothetical protein
MALLGQAQLKHYRVHKKASRAICDRVIAGCDLHAHYYLGLDLQGKPGLTPLLIPQAGLFAFRLGRYGPAWRKFCGSSFRKPPPASTLPPGGRPIDARGEDAADQASLASRALGRPARGRIGGSGAAR